VRAVARIMAVLLVAAVVLGFIWLAILGDMADEKACVALGGHRHTFHSYGTSSDGKFVQTSETRCLTPDGRFLDTDR
jgi:hypothetical protein